MWHASIAVLTADGPVLAAELPEASVHKARMLARSLVAGVGTGSLIEQTGDIALHCRRSLSDREIAGLDPEWLAIEPVDMG